MESGRRGWKNRRYFVSLVEEDLKGKKGWEMGDI